MVFVFRRPSTMEDEGRYEYRNRFGSEKQADDYIDALVKESNGYYSKHSFLKAKEIK